MESFYWVYIYYIVKYIYIYIHTYVFDTSSISKHLTIKRCALNRGSRVIRTNDIQTLFVGVILHILLIVKYQV